MQRGQTQPRIAGVDTKNAWGCSGLIQTLASCGKLSGRMAAVILRSTECSSSSTCASSLLVKGLYSNTLGLRLSEPGATTFHNEPSLSCTSVPGG